MQTSTSLTFFTAIFVALSGALAEDNNNNGRNGSFFNVAGYLIEERRRWPVITAPHEENVLNKFRILKERHVQMRKPYQSPGRMKNSSYYIAPVGD